MSPDIVKGIVTGLLVAIIVTLLPLWPTYRAAGTSGKIFIGAVIIFPVVLILNLVWPA